MSMRKRLILILAAVLIVKVAIVIIFKTYEHPVKWEYETVVSNILSGKGYVHPFLGATYRSLTTPLYVLLCYVIYLLTNHSYFVVLFLQSLFTIFLALVIFTIGKKIFDEKVGFISAIVAACHPGFLYYDAFNLMPLSIDAFLIATITMLFLKFKDSPSVLKMCGVGALIGLGALSRGTTGALLPFLSLYLILFARKLVLKVKLKYIAILSLATFVVITPWVIRNYVIHKQFVFIVSATGEFFWRGNNKYAVGTSLTRDGKTMLDLWPETFQKKVYSMNEMEQKKFFEKEALDFIRANPAAFLKLYFKKIYYFWWFSPQSGYIYPKIYLAIYKCAYTILIAFSVLGIILALLFGGKAVSDQTWLLMFVFMSAFLTQSFFYVEGRHRWLIEPLMGIFFVYGLSRFWEIFIAIKNKQQRIK